VCGENVLTTRGEHPTSLARPAQPAVVFADLMILIA
jgi:hypothetical protein